MDHVTEHQPGRGEGCWDRLGMDHVTEHRPGRGEACWPLSEFPRKIPGWDSRIFHPFIQPVDKSCWRWQEAGNIQKVFARDTWLYKPCLRSGTPPRDTAFVLRRASPLNTIDFSRSPVLKVVWARSTWTALNQSWAEGHLSPCLLHSWTQSWVSQGCMGQGKTERSTAVHFPEQADQHLPSEAPPWNTPSNQSPWLWHILGRERDRWELLGLVQLVPSVTHPASSLLGSRDLTVRHRPPQGIWSLRVNQTWSSVALGTTWSSRFIASSWELSLSDPQYKYLWKTAHSTLGRKANGIHMMVQTCPAGGAGKRDGAFSGHECGTSVGEQRDGWVLRVIERPKRIFNLGTQVPCALG